jgi:NADH-quinone oxidoreductase subunit N
MTQTSLSTFLLAGPEITLVIAALVAYLGGAFCGLRQGWLVALVGIAAAACWPGLGLTPGALVSSGPLSLDTFSLFIRGLVLAAGAGLALLQSGDQLRGAVTHRATSRGEGTCEEAGTFLLLLAGLSLVASANDLVLLFAGLELVSIPTYVLLALKRTDARGQEASLKYFFLSLVASALFLYGLACLYGIGGSTNLADIGARLRSPDGRIAATADVLLPVAVGMVIGGIAFRLAAVPMHFYAPDVYEGTGPANAALLSTLPKVAGIVMLLRLLALGTGGTSGMMALNQGVVGPAAATWLTVFWQLAAILAALTMTVGNVMALLQNNLRRMLACSSIAHAGYLLVGVAAAAAADSTIGGRPFPGPDTSWIGALGGASATLFYLATYVAATIGVFGALAYLGHRWPEWSAGSAPRPPREEISTVDDLDGLSGTNPVVAFSLATFLLSLAGIPPLPGFWGKLSLAMAALEVDWTARAAPGSRRVVFLALAVTLVLNAAIAAAYYLRLVAAMYFRSAKRGVQADGGLGAGVAMLASLLLVAMFTFQPRSLFSAASQAGASIAAPHGTVAAPQASAQP